MNNFLIYEGNQPVYLDDLQFINQATLDALTGIVEGIQQTNSPVILYGCDITSVPASSGQTTYSNTAGYVSVLGEVYPVKAGSVTTSTGANLYWEIVTEKDGQRRLGNGTEQYVYEKKYIRLASTGSILVVKDNTLYKYIKNSLDKQNTEWDGTVTDQEEWYGSIKYKLLGKEGNRILFNNVIVNATSDKKGVIFKKFPVEQIAGRADYSFMVPAMERTETGLVPITLNLSLTATGYVTAYKNGEIYKNDVGETTINCVIELYNSDKL